MRLAILDLAGMRPLQRWKLRLFKRMAGYIPPPFLALSYRRELFGRNFVAAFQETMRRPSAWQVGELELFAAFVSQLNRCAY